MIFGATFGLQGVAIAAAVAFSAGGYASWWVTSSYYAYRNATATVRAQQVDLGAAKDAEADTAERVQELLEQDAKNVERIRDLEQKLRALPADRRCVLDDDAARRLRNGR